MAITSHTTLVAAVADWLDRSDLTSQIIDFVAFAEKKLYRKLRVSDMETAFTSTISSGVIPVPTGYLEMKNAYVDGAPIQPLTRTNLSFIYENHKTRSATAKPVNFAREGTNFIFGPFPDSAYDIVGIYYKELDALSSSNETNFIITSSPQVLLYGALLEAEPFLQNDERIPIWKSKFDEALADLQLQDTNEALSGSPIAVTALTT